VRRLAGVAARLDAAERRALSAVPAAARPALPVVVGPDGAVRCPIFSQDAARARSLALARMQAACGAIIKEPAA
jgi:tRNA(Ile)-lysidine synthase